MRPVALLLAVALLWAPAQPLLAQASARIIAIGDIHGSIDGFKSILKAAGLTDAQRQVDRRPHAADSDRRLHRSRRQARAR